MKFSLLVLVILFHRVALLRLNQLDKLEAILGKEAVFTWQYFLEEGENVEKISIEHKDQTSNLYVIAVVKEDLIWNTVGGSNWFKDNGYIRRNESSVQLVFPVKDAVRYDNYIFQCQIESSRKVVASSKTEFHIIYAPIIRPGQAPTESKNEGQTLSLSCAADSKPPPITQWYHGAQLLPDKGSENTLSLQKINRNQSGNYTCIASNPAGFSSISVIVNVRYKPTIIRSRSTLEVSSYVGNKNPVTLHCVADGIPAPKYFWNQEKTNRQVAQNSNFTLYDPSLDQFGNYICEASNELGFDRMTTIVKEIKRPDSFNVSVIDINSRFASVSFKLPDLNGLGNSYVKKVTLSYKTMDGPIQKLLLDENTSWYKLTDLKPYTKYEVNVTVTNEEFESIGLPKIFETMQSEPGPPSIASMESISQDSIKLSWSPPNEPNGVLTKYSLKIFEKDLSFDNVTAIDIFNTSATSHVFDGLKSYTLYIAAVSASTKVGEGLWSNRSAQYTDSEPQDAPENVTIFVLSPVKISIHWQPPKHVKPGLITKYGIFINCTSLETTNLSVNSLIVNADGQINRNVEVDRMRPYSACQLRVRLGSGEKPIWGIYSQDQEFVMPEGAPNKVLNFEVIGSSHGQIHLKWTRPATVNGVLSKFVIVYSNDTGEYTEILTKQLDNATFFYTLSYLKAEAKYSIYVVAHSRNENSEKSDVIRRTTAQFVVALPEKESNKSAVLAGVISVLFILAIAVAVFLYIKRRKNRHSIKGTASFKKLPPPSDSPQVEFVDGNAASITNPSYSSLPAPSVTFLPIQYDGKDQSCANRIFKPIRPFLITALKDFVARSQEIKDKALNEEFRNIKPEGNFTYEISSRPENKCKNRYANIVAYDHSRVVLNTVENLDGSDYVNANYVDGYSRKAKFISTQGPVVAAFNDFWRMVWEQNTSTIVMVTNLVERSRIKCQKYWPSPDEEVQVQGNIRIYPQEEMELADYIIRKFKVALMKDDVEVSSRQVTQYQFLSWPDHGVPRFATPLLQFVKRIRMLPNDGTPVIVHCSAGVGRTGTFIALDAMLDQIEAEAAIDVLGYVTHIRSQRNFLVQTDTQYVFLFSALLEFVLCGETEVNTMDFPARIKHLNTLNPGTTQSFIQEEFQRLDINIGDVDKFLEASLPINEEKNRFQDLLPYELTRVKLWPFPEVEGSDYINANFIDGYQQREAYILTQAPLENTISDFWRMLWEYEVFSVVMISSPTERDKNHCYPYWPINNDATLFGLLSVQITGEEEKNGFMRREFRVTNTKNGESRVLSHFMYFNWSVDEAPESASIIEMIGELQKTQQQTGNSIIVFHCSDGSGRCGALVALMYCLERLKLEGVVDVFQTVRSMRTQRPALVKTLEQYQFIYKAVRNFLDCFSDYANFK